MPHDILVEPSDGNTCASDDPCQGPSGMGLDAIALPATLTTASDISFLVRAVMTVGPAAGSPQEQAAKAEPRQRRGFRDRREMVRDLTAAQGRVVNRKLIQR